MKSYEGKCRYCGETEIMMAESQKEADQITSENCDCGGYEEELRHDAWRDSVIKICKGNERYNMDELPDKMCAALAQMSEAIYQGTFEQIKIKTPSGETIDMTTGRPCTITRTCKNVINGELEE